MRHGHRRQCVGCIRNRGRLDLSYDAGASRGRREAGRYVCCWCGVVWDAESGGGLPVHRHSYRGHRVELWMIADLYRLKCSKRQLNVKQNRQLGCTWALCGTNRHSVFQTNGRARGLGFLLNFSMYIFLAPNGQGTPVFGRCPK